MTIDSISTEYLTGSATTSFNEMTQHFNSQCLSTLSMYDEMDVISE